MPLEIERKFLVTGTAWRSATGTLYRQGYLSRDKTRTVRVRVAGGQGFLTIKGVTTGATRAEFEYAIPVADAEQFAYSIGYLNGQGSGEQLPDLDIEGLSLPRLDERDAAFAHAIHDAALRRWITLGYLIERYTPKPFRENEPQIRERILGREANEAGTSGETAPAEQAPADQAPAAVTPAPSN